MENVRRRAEDDAKSHGYYLNSDPDILRDLLEGLEKNEERYGYPSCPCRLAAGKFEFDRDIVCPCYYRDPDIEEYGACYCSLYVRKDIFEGKTPLQPIPERRPPEKQARAYTKLPETGEKPSVTATQNEKGSPAVKLELWYCRQCGYLVYREDPPYICPICKSKKIFTKIRIEAELQE